MAKWGYTCREDIKEGINDAALSCVREVLHDFDNLKPDELNGNVLLAYMAQLHGIMEMHTLIMADIEEEEEEEQEAKEARKAEEEAKKHVEEEHF